jgi:proline iminopeptidase
MADIALPFGLSENIRNSLRQAFARFHEIDSVLMYGSRATGTFRPHSDIDLAVVAPTMTEREFSRLWTTLDDLPILFRLDVVLWDQLTNPTLKQNILEDGVVFYRAAQSPTSSPDPSPRARHP